jgi:hypothetical protein
MVHSAIMTMARHHSGEFIIVVAKGLIFLCLTE